MRFVQAMAFIYSFAASWVPGLLRILPPETLRLVFESVEAVLNKRLKVDFKFNNWVGMVLTLKEIAEAVVTNNEKEQMEAAYSLLVLITDIEKYLTLEQFIASLGHIPQAETR